MGKHLLIVDNEPQFRLLAAIALKRAGYKISEAITGHEALQLISENREGFDLILTELALSGLTGIELIRELQKLEITTPVCVVTGSTDQELIGTLLKNNCSGFVYKPFGLQQLVDHVDGILNEAQESPSDLQGKESMR